ncbi:MAG: NifU family protein [Jatrophihabitans sp.]
MAQLSGAGDSPAGRMHEAAARIESLLEASAAGGPMAQSRAEDLVGCVSALYGGGMGRLLDVLYDAGVLSEQVLDAIADDELVSGLLLVHDLHPYDVSMRVQRALDGVRPYLGSHGGDVEMLGIDEDGVLTLQLLGSCDGCPSSSATLELAVEGAVRTAAPELTGIQVRTSVAAGAASDKGGLISLGSLRTRIDGPAEPAVAGTWVAVAELAALTEGVLTGLVVDGVRVCACRIGKVVFCFRDRCGRCGQDLSGGVVERRLGDPAGTAVLRCARCRAHFDARQGGVGLDDPAEHLEPLPVLARDGTVSVAVPAVPVTASAAP